MVMFKEYIIPASGFLKNKAKLFKRLFFFCEQQSNWHPNISSLNFFFSSLLWVRNPVSPEAGQVTVCLE
jgi:hypothetical protein